MTITADAMVDPLAQPDQWALQLVDEDGRLTRSGVEYLAEIRSFLSGCNRVIACDASGKNVITLTPVVTAPLFKKYASHDIYAARAEQTSDGSVTATVVPAVGSLATVKVYKSAGAAQAGSGDIVADSVYLFVYAEHLDGGAGGLVLK